MAHVTLNDEEHKASMERRKRVAFRDWLCKILAPRLQDLFEMDGYKKESIWDLGKSGITIYFYKSVFITKREKSGFRKWNNKTKEHKHQKMVVDIFMENIPGMDIKYIIEISEYDTTYVRDRKCTTQEVAWQVVELINNIPELKKHDYEIEVKI